jgi:hypothetical protein
MPALESLKQSILTECEEDHVGLWSVIRDAEDHFPKKDEAAIRAQVLRLLGELLVAHEIRAGFPTPEGKFRSLRTTPERVLQRIAAEWSPGKRPTIGEGLWFTRARKTGRNLRSCMATSGPVERRKMYERSKKEVGLAPAHACHKKRLRQQPDKRN